MAVNGILGKKVGMTQLFDDKGEVRPVTVLQAGPCVVTQRKGATRDGYEAAQIGLIEFVKESRLTKPMKGHFGKHNLPPVKFMREVTIEAGADGDGTKVGDKVLVDIFDGEKFVDIVGTTKGRGFAGVVKRHKFGGGPAAHGHMFQVVGSIGASSFPSRVFKGKRSAGSAGRIHFDFEGEESSERASWVRWSRNGRSVEGFETPGCEEEIAECAAWVAAQHRTKTWQRLMF